MTPADPRAAIVAAAKTMHREGLVVGTAGNVSGRASQPDAMHITPSRTDYATLEPDAVVTVSFDGDPIEGAGLPSTESLLHGAIYRKRPDVSAVVHAHPTFASVLAVRRELIPTIVDEQIFYLGGGVEVSSYATASSPDLAAHAVDALGPRNAVLLANHGSVTVGRDPAEALEATRLVERLATIWYFASMRPGVGRLPDDVIQSEVELFLMMQEADAG